jgi:hypothetical protein
VRIVTRREPGLDEGGARGKAGQIRLLGQIAHGDRRLDENGSGIGLDQPGSDFQERRLARTVAADQAQALARAELKLRAFEQRFAAEGQVDVLQMKKRRLRHGVLWESFGVSGGLWIRGLGECTRRRSRGIYVREFSAGSGLRGKSRVPGSPAWSLTEVNSRRARFR